jgi:ABC-2 type transport system permease protein
MVAETAPVLAPVGPMLYEQVRAELLKLLRSPIFSIFSLALPLIFYAFFGIANANSTLAGVHGGTFLMASFAAYAMANVMLFTFGITIAVERGRRMDVLMRATPLRGSVFLVSRIAAAVCFAVAALFLLGVFASITGGVRLGAGQWLGLGWKLLVGSLPLLLLGFAIGYVVSPNSAAAVVNLVGLPMYFASGLFEPLRFMPDFVQKVAPYLPTYLYGQLAWNAVGAQSDPVSRDLLGLAVYAAFFLALALWAYNRQQSRRFS